MNTEQLHKLDLIITRAMDNAIANGENGTSYSHWKDNPALKDMYDEEGQPRQASQGTEYDNRNSRENTNSVPTLLGSDGSSFMPVSTKAPQKNLSQDPPFFDPDLDIPEATANFTYTREARPQQIKSGKLSTHKLTKTDGGGKHEVAGINERYHPEKLKQIQSLINEGKQGEAIQAVKDHYIDYTNPSVKWIPDMLTEYFNKNGYPMGEGVKHQLDAIEGMIRDTAFNRGIQGSMVRFQKALNKTAGTQLNVDGSFGPKSRAVLADLLSKNAPEEHANDDDYWVKKLLKNYKDVTLESENKKRPEWPGMKNRINNRHIFAEEILEKNNSAKGDN